MRRASSVIALLAFIFLGCAQTGPSQSELALQTQVARQATQIAALQDQQFRATWEAAETATALAQAPPSSTESVARATMPPMPRVFLEISGSGDLVTENYEWGPCQKAVFFWSVTDDTSLIVNGCRVDTGECWSLIRAHGPGEGQVLQPLLGGVYYLALETVWADTSWTIKGECQDVGSTATTPTSREVATPTELPPAPTNLPPTATTSVPTATPVPSVETVERNETQQIGPIWDSLHDEDFSMEVTLKSLQWFRGDRSDEPKPGHVFVIVRLRVKNLGPGASRSISSMDFEVIDANGAVRGDTYVYATRDCRLAFVDLTVGGSIEGCISFEVPDQGKVDLIYAPFRYEGLEPGRYLSFNLRP